MQYSASTARDAHLTCAVNLAFGFAAGFLSVLVFHQLTGALYYLTGIGTNAPYNMQPIPPFNVPRVISLAFWGGVWGVVFAAIRPWLPRAAIAFLIAGFLFAIVGPIFYSWFVLAPMNGRPAAQGWQTGAMLRSIGINGMYGVGVATFLLLADRLRGGGWAA